MFGRLPEAAAASRFDCRYDAKIFCTMSNGERKLSLAFRRHRRLCELARCSRSGCIALAHRTAPTELLSATLLRQTSRKHHRLRLHPSQNIAWKFAVAELLLKTVLSLLTSVALSSAAVPPHGMRKLAFAATDVYRKFNRPGNDVNVAAAMAFAADPFPKNGSNFPRETGRPTATGTWQYGDVERLIGEKGSRDPPRASEGLDMSAKRMRKSSDSSRTLLPLLSAEDLTEVPTGRILVRREALLHKNVAAHTDLPSINPGARPPVLNDSFQDSTTAPRTTTESVAPTTEDLYEVLRKAIEAAFLTDELDPAGENQQGSQTTISYTTTKEIKASLTLTTRAYEQTSVTARGESKASTSASAATVVVPEAIGYNSSTVQPNKVSTMSALSSMAPPSGFNKTSGGALGTASTPIQAMTTGSDGADAQLNFSTSAASERPRKRCRRKT